MPKCTEEGRAGQPPQAPDQVRVTFDAGWRGGLTWGDSLDLDRRLFYPLEVYVLRFIH